MSIGTVLRTEGIEANPYLSPAQRLVALDQQQRIIAAARRNHVEVQEKN